MPKLTDYEIAVAAAYGDDIDQANRDTEEQIEERIRRWEAVGK